MLATQLSNLASGVARAPRFIPASQPMLRNDERRSTQDQAANARSIGQEQAGSNWNTLSTQVLDQKSLQDLFNNKLPDIRVPGFLSDVECHKLVDVIRDHEIGAYNENVYPPIGSVGITQFDHQSDKPGYFSKVEGARRLQDRFLREAGIDVLGRVQETLQRHTTVPVRIAREGQQKYFAGLIRLINRSALLHADFGPYDGPGWEIGGVVAQLTWNILLKEVDGGESTVFDRFWRGPADDELHKLPKPSYGYQHSAVANRASKTMKYQQGDLHFFNSRNFHLVKALTDTEEGSRYTMSSFVGLLPATEYEGPTLVLWS